MPCDSIERTKVEFLAKSTDAKLLAKGLRAHGYAVTENSQGLNISKRGKYGSYNQKTGALDIPQSWDSQEFKRAYSEQVVTQTAAEHGWEIEWKTNDAGNLEATVEKSV